MVTLFVKIHIPRTPTKVTESEPLGAQPGDRHFKKHPSLFWGEYHLRTHALRVCRGLSWENSVQSSPPGRRMVKTSGRKAQGQVPADTETRCHMSSCWVTHPWFRLNMPSQGESSSSSELITDASGIETIFSVANGLDTLMCRDVRCWANRPSCCQNTSGLCWGSIVPVTDLITEKVPGWCHTASSPATAFKSIHCSSLTQKRFSPPLFTNGDRNTKLLDFSKVKQQGPGGDGKHSGFYLWHWEPSRSVESWPRQQPPNVAQMLLLSLRESWVFFS